MAEMNHLACLRPGNLGSLGFLPIEVCNKIHAYLLADFHPHKVEAHLTEATLEDDPEELHYVSHSIDTAILRASRDVHREAYDLMVKENRFVHLKCQGIPRLLMIGLVPVVTANTEHVRQFKGYVLEANASHQGEQLPPQLGGNGAFEAMILASDLNGFYQSLMVGNLVPGFSSRLTLRLELGPVVAAGREARDYEDLESLKCFFTEKTQKGLLRPLSDNLYGVQDVQICGLVSADLVSSTLKTVASDKWGGPQQVLDHLATQKEIGMQLLRENKHHVASHSWTQDIIEIDVLREGGNWSRLVQQGGEEFIHQLAEMYFQLNLNCLHINLRAPIDEELTKVTETFLLRAQGAMKTGCWKAGFTWRPSEGLEAKLHFRTARFYRLRGDPSDVQQAINEIGQASQLCPDDPVILRERQLLSEWAAEAVLAAQ